MLIETNQEKPAFILMALNQPTIAQDELVLKTYGLSFKRCHGSYNGILEHSYLIPLTDVGVELKCYELGLKFKQDSILKVDINRQAKLQFIDGRTFDLGQFVCVPKLEALASDCWTKSNGRYYITINKG